MPCTKGVKVEKSYKNLSFTCRGPLEMLIFMSIMNLLLQSANKSFNIYKPLVIPHNKAQFILGTMCANCDSVSHNIEALPL